MACFTQIYTLNDTPGRMIKSGLLLKICKQNGESVKSTYIPFLLQNVNYTNIVNNDI